MVDGDDNRQLPESIFYSSVDQSETGQHWSTPVNFSPTNERSVKPGLRVTNFSGVCHAFYCVRNSLSMPRKFFARRFPAVQKVVRALPKRRSAAQIMLNRAMARTRLMATR